MKKIYYLLLILVAFGCTDQKKEEEKRALNMQKESLEMLLLDSSANGRNMAKGLIKNAIELAPHLDVLYATQVELLLRDSAFTQAIESIDKAIELKPEMAEYWVQKGHIEQAATDSSAAIVSFEQAIKLYDIRISKGRDRESSLINKWFVRMTVDHDLKKNTKALFDEVEADPTIDRQRIEESIEMMKELNMKNWQ